MKKLNIFFRETYEGYRKLEVEMTDEDYEEYCNSYVLLDSIIKNSKSIDDLKNRYNEIRNPGFKIKNITSDKKLKDNLTLESFDLDYYQSDYGRNSKI